MHSQPLPVSFLADALCSHRLCTVFFLPSVHFTGICMNVGRCLRLGESGLGFNIRKHSWLYIWPPFSDFSFFRKQRGDFVPNPLSSLHLFHFPPSLELRKARGMLYWTYQNIPISVAWIDELEKKAVNKKWKIKISGGSSRLFCIPGVGRLGFGNLYWNTWGIQYMMCQTYPSQTEAHRH